MDISLGVVGSLVHLIANSVLGGSSTGSQACVRVLGDVLVGLLGNSSSGTLNGLRDVLCGVLKLKMLAGVYEDGEAVKLI